MKTNFCPGIYNCAKHIVKAQFFISLPLSNLSACTSSFPFHLKKHFHRFCVPSTLTNSGSCVGCAHSTVNLISSPPGSASYFSSLYHPTSYLPFRAKLALLSPHLFTPQSTKINGSAEKEEPAALGFHSKVGSLPRQMATRTPSQD